MTKLWLTGAACALITACAANAQPPQPSLSPAKAPAEDAVGDILGSLEEPPAPATAGVMTMADPGVEFRDDSRFAQAGLAFGQTVPGSRISLDGIAVPVDRNGRFVLGFGQFAEPTATISVTYPDGTAWERTVDIAESEFAFGGEITVDPRKVNAFTEEDLVAIGRSTKLKNAARAEPSSGDALWLEGFQWPATGYVTSRFGKYRTYNGEVQRPHSGVDIASPRTAEGGPSFDFTGTPVVAPSAGVVILADPDMFFEGGLVLIDHGQNLETAIMHMSKIDVAPGDFVERGDKIGEAGNTGRTTGAHVHWSLKWHKRLVDPEKLVPPMDEVAG